VSDREERRHINALTREAGIQVQRGADGWTAHCVRDGKRVVGHGKTKRAAFRKIMEVLK
jgi:hypothetical protein